VRGGGEIGDTREIQNLVSFGTCGFESHPPHFMRPLVEREIVAHLAAGQLNACQIADITKIPSSTIRGWIQQPTSRPRVPKPLLLDLGSLPRCEYSYLLGFYLGDGTISQHRRDVYRLRIVTDARYPGVIAECAATMKSVMPENRVLIQKRPSRCVEISCYSKLWPLLFPQHGPGKKHTRKIVLEPWQEEIVQAYPREFLRGLIHSDGCRVLNRVNGKDYPRYLFKQISDDIRGLFCQTCDLLGIAYRFNRWNEVSIARAPSVALMDSFIGPKI
jgi:hypothetical protein